jgi:hypothetical protein
MPARPARLLCAGEDLALLETRCAVLKTEGYKAQAAIVEEAEILLRTDVSDLVIVSAWLTDWERGSILSAAGKTPALVLTDLVLADKLLHQVEHLLSGDAD